MRSNRIYRMRSLPRRGARKGSARGRRGDLRFGPFPSGEPYERPDRRHDQDRAENSHQDARMTVSHDVTHHPDKKVNTAVGLVWLVCETLKLKLTK